MRASSDRRVTAQEREVVLGVAEFVAPLWDVSYIGHVCRAIAVASYCGSIVITVQAWQGRRWEGLKRE